MAAIEGGESVGVEAGDQRRDRMPRSAPGAGRGSTEGGSVGHRQQRSRVGHPVGAVARGSTNAFQLLALGRGERSQWVAPSTTHWAAPVRPRASGLHRERAIPPVTQPLHSCSERSQS